MKRIVLLLALCFLFFAGEVFAFEQNDAGTLKFNSNIRRNPGIIEGNILQVLPQGTEVKIGDEFDGWYNIVHPDVTGWVTVWLVEKEEQKKSFVPLGIDSAELNRYWLEAVNVLREQHGVRELVLDQRFVNTAIEWAGDLGDLQDITHTRLDGKSMHEWIDSQELDFTKRYSVGGWIRNYFTENIGTRYVQGTMEEAKKALDSILFSFLKEQSFNGAHYRTIYHPDWNSVGTGFHFKPFSGETYKMYVVSHYGSLQLEPEAR